MYQVDLLGLLMSLVSLGLRSPDFIVLQTMDPQSYCSFKGPVKSLDSFDSYDSLSDFKDEDEGVTNIGLREDPWFLLFYLHARRERVARGQFRSIFGLPLRMELMLHDLLIFQLDSELTCHQCRVRDLENRLSKRIRRSGELTQQVKGETRVD